MPFDYEAHKRAMYRHCRLLISLGQQEYVLVMAARWEQESHGVLEGLHAKVVQVIEKQKREPDA